MRRTLTTLIATVGLLLAGLVGSPTGAQTAGDKPTRSLHDAIVKKHGKLIFQGRVDPGHGPVYVQKKDCRKQRCPWHKFKRVTTHGPKDHWQVRVFAPRHNNWYWRAYVKSYGGYTKSWSHVWKTYVSRF